jgi:predicted phage terminase large subunit-like protein
MKNISKPRDMLGFLIKTMEEIDPSTSYVHNWHIELICDYLKKCESGEIKRLIINIPPRSLKSVSVSVAFPAWIMGRDPMKKVICVSYSQAISNKHSIDCKQVVESSWYKNIFDTEILKKENNKRKFMTTKNGFRLATSTGGSLTGEGGDFIIVDDPHNPAKIYSKNERAKCINWFENVLSSRLNNKQKGCIIVIMQRLHADDLCGYLLKHKGDIWHHLSIPVIADCNIQYYFFNKLYKEMKKNEILNSKRDSNATIENIKKESGSIVFNAQYQQNPEIEKSSYIDVSKISIYDKNNINIKDMQIYFSIDTATKISDQHDYTVISIIGEFQSSYYILDLIRDRMQYAMLKQRLIHAISQYFFATILIEDRGLGSALIQDISTLRNVKIVSINPKENKINRFMRIIGIIESGSLLIDKDAKWKDDLLQEINAFPIGKHDDQVDTISQFLNWKLDMSVSSRGPRIGFL